MEAKEHSFSFIKDHCFYDIPFFQRNYVWDEQNWEDLLYSLCESKTGFLGSIILKQKTGLAGKTARCIVIDGQQRLTTLSILVRACYDTIIDRNEEFQYDDDYLAGFKHTFEDMCYVQNNLTRQKDIKIQHSHLDRHAYELVINGKLNNDLNLNESKIISAYKYFKRVLANYDREKLILLWDVLTNTNTKLIVIIVLKENENEQAIFDAINTSGVHLSCADTIKNVLFQKVIDLYKNKNVENAEAITFELYKTEWLSIFSDTEEMSKFWSKERLTGRIKRDNLETFLRSIAVIQGFYEPEDQKFSELAGCYKEFIKGLTLEELIEFIKKIRLYANMYMNRLCVDDKKTYYRFDDYLPRLLCICEKLDISSFNPYILHIVKLYNDLNDENTLREKCFEIERYLMLHALCDATRKNYNKECVQLINGNQTTSSLLNNDYEINKRKFYETINNMKRKDRLAKLVLFWCELYERKIKNVDIKELMYNFELEHILPKNWKKHWSVEDLNVYDEKGRTINDSTIAMEVRENSVNKLGNLTILNKKLNIQISNGTYLEKLDGNNKHEGIKVLSDYLMTKDIINTYSSWDERNINERTTYLIELISKIWNITWDSASKPVISSNNNSLYLSNPPKFFTKKEFSQIKISLPGYPKVERSLPSRKFTDYYIFFLNYLIEIGVDFYEVRFQNKFNYLISSNKNEFSEGKADSLRQLNNGMYVCTKDGNDGKVKSLQNILKHFHLEVSCVEFVIREKI